MIGSVTRKLKALPYFQDLGLKIEAQWRRKNFDEETIADIAERALRASPAHRRVTPEQVIDHVLSDAEMPAPLAASTGSFGQPPVTVFRTARFVIDVLFWFDGTTSIHSHAFSGAFQVFAGSSVHGIYDFEPDQVISSWMRAGKVQLREMQLLRIGDTRRILSGSRFRHSLFHLDRPSVSIVVRTIHDAAVGLQYHYDPPYFETASFVTDQRADLRLAVLRGLRGIDPVKYAKRVIEEIGELDLQTCFTLLRAVSADREPVLIARAFAAARKRHGAVVDRLTEVIDETRRQAAITGRRVHAQSAEHRFFLALLLVAPDRRRIFELTRARFPRAKPIDTVMRWVTELSELPSPTGDHEPNALGVTMGNAELFVLRKVLEGATAEGLIAAMRKIYEPEEVDANREHLLTLRESFRRFPMFQNLFIG